MAKRKTMKQRNLESLQARGWNIDNTTRVTKYTVLSNPGESDHYYLGNAGAVRRGRTVSESISVKLKLVEVGVGSGKGHKPSRASQEALGKLLGKKLKAKKFAEAIDDAAKTTSDCPASCAEAEPPNPSNPEGSPCPVRPTEPRSALGKLLAASVNDVETKRRLDSAPHLIVEARAGTGKTTTLITGLQALKGLQPTDAKGRQITPSPQQAAVWEQIALSRGVKSICFVAFNKSIATELQQRVPPDCDAMTMHSMGFRAVTKMYGQLEVSEWVVPDIIADILGRDIRELRRDPTMLTMVKATEELVSLCKMNLAEASASTHFPGDGSWESILDNLASHYGVDLNGSRERVFELVPQVLERCRTPQGRINFDDMIWLPVVNNLAVFCYDLLLVDEAQDLNRCQQALAKKAGRRLVLCGDPKQAIYGFAGADAESMKRMEHELAGCVTLPLTVTRRCGKAIVREANRWVPDFSAHETNPEGKIGRAAYKGPKDAPIEGKESEHHGVNGDWSTRACYEGLVAEGDFILCRYNAPLVSACFRFLKAGRKAVIQGRDIGKGLISTIKKLAKAPPRPVELSGQSIGRTEIVELVAKLTDWGHAEVAKENAKRNPSEARVTAIQDRVDCLLCFTEGCQTVDEVEAKIDRVFTDAKDSPGIRLSSVHKAKGLEARRVFILQPPNIGPREDKMQGWELEQERNLQYVAITRAIEELVYIS